MRRAAVVALTLVALLAATAGLAAFAAPTGQAQRAASVSHGRSLFVEGCSACHGMDARGIPARAPSLIGAGALAADFYLRTGRMPLAHPTDAPVRAKPAYGENDIEDLVAYVGSLGGPPIPAVHAGAASLAQGKELFTQSCAGCHQELAKGGIVTGAIAPSLQQASATQVAEAVRIGPYLMPRFGPKQLTQSDVDALARYVLYTRHLDNRGGWGIGNIGPIPEGMVAWFIAIVALIGVARIIGTRTET